MLFAVAFCESRRRRGCVSFPFYVPGISLSQSVFWGWRAEGLPVIDLNPSTEANTLRSLKQAAADPSSLTQEKIISNLNDAEKGRLSRIRNIGIAVCGSMP